MIEEYSAWHAKGERGFVLKALNPKQQTMHRLSQMNIHIGWAYNLFKEVGWHIALAFQLSYLVMIPCHRPDTRLR